MKEIYRSSPTHITIVYEVADICEESQEKNLKMTGLINAFKLNYCESTARPDDIVQVGGLAHGPAVGNEALVITTHLTTDI